CLGTHTQHFAEGIDHWRMQVLVVLVLLFFALLGDFGSRGRLLTRLRHTGLRLRLRMHFHTARTCQGHKDRHNRKSSQQVAHYRLASCTLTPFGNTARRTCSLSMSVAFSICCRAITVESSICLRAARTFSCASLRTCSSALSRSPCHCFNRCSRAASTSARAARSLSSYTWVSASAAEIALRACSTAPLVRARRSARARSRGRRTSRPYSTTVRIKKIMVGTEPSTRPPSCCPISCMIYLGSTRGNGKARTRRLHAAKRSRLLT